MTLIAGAATTGSPQSAAAYNVATSVDRNSDIPFFDFSIDGVSISSSMQSGIRNVRASFLDISGQTRSLMLDGSFPAIVSISMFDCTLC
jgi:hypothetical protein